MEFVVQFEKWRIGFTKTECEIVIDGKLSMSIKFKNSNGNG